jgi:diguanylate cyclase (GGDEF)-like protein
MLRALLPSRRSPVLPTLPGVDDATARGHVLAARAEVQRELHRMLLLNRTTFPLGVFSAGAVLATLAWPYLPTRWVLAWLVINSTVSVIWIAALVPPLVDRLDRDGLPLLFRPLGYACGLTFGAFAWLDLHALARTPLEWIVLAVLFAVSSGAQSGTVIGTPHALRVQLPMWATVAPAYAVIHAWTVVGGLVIFVVLVARDSATSRRLVVAGVEARMAAARAAVTDPLTGLVNRVGAYAALEHLGDPAVRLTIEHVAVLYVDLDRFKQVNDRLGHAAGDHLLVQTGQRLRDCSREGDVVARLGGDEFLLILPLRRNAPVDTRSVAERIIRSLEEAFQFDGQEAHVSASVGVVVVSARSALDPDELVRHADRALYEAKDTGRGRAVHTFC